jgi:hypothetical protein
VKIISLKIHGLLDYGTVAAFAILPAMTGMQGIPAYLCYALAVIHFLMTIFTKFPLGVFKLIPIGLHKMVELVVGPLLVAIPWILGFSSDAIARNVFIAAGIIILLVGILTDYFETR